MKIRVKSFKELLNKFRDEDIIEFDEQTLSMICGDKTSDHYGDKMSLNDLQTMGMLEIKQENQDE